MYKLNKWNNFLCYFVSVYFIVVKRKEWECCCSEENLVWWLLLSNKWMDDDDDVVVRIFSMLIKRHNRVFSCSFLFLTLILPFIEAEAQQRKARQGTYSFHVSTSCRWIPTIPTAFTVFLYLNYDLMIFYKVI